MGLKKTKVVVILGKFWGYRLNMLKKAENYRMNMKIPKFEKYKKTKNRENLGRYSNVYLVVKCQICSKKLKLTPKN